MSIPIVCDLFTFSEELDVLDIRLNELNNAVDYFCLVESCYTQSRLFKPYYFDLNRDRYKDFLHKIIHVKSNRLVPGVSWEAEHAQRRDLIKCLNILIDRNVGLDDDSYFIMGDVDEIPRESVVKDIVSKKTDLSVVNHYFGSYFLNWHSTFRDPWGWYGSVIGKLGVLQHTDIQWFRANKDSLNKSGNSGEGWHFSSLLTNGFDSLYNKWATRIEPMDKSHIEGDINKERLRVIFNKHVLEDKFFLFCDNPENRSVRMDKLDFELLPDHVKDNNEKFRHILA